MSFALIRFPNVNDMWEDNDSQALPAFFKALGSQADLVHRAVLDVRLFGSHENAYDVRRGWRRRDLCGNIPLREDLQRGPGKVEVTEVLHAVWAHSPLLDVTIAEFNDKHPHINPTYVVHGITAPLRSLLGGQLGLQKYGNAFQAAALNIDSSGGLVAWSRVAGNGRYVPDADLIDTFVASEGGATLAMAKRAQPLSLLRLPKGIQRAIFDLVLRPHSGVVINVNQDKSFDAGLLHVNKAVYHEWRGFYFVENTFVLEVHAPNAGNVLSMPDGLIRLLRKSFPYQDHEDVTCLGTILQGKVYIIIIFESTTLSLLQDVRINVLPLVMETCTAYRDTKITFRLMKKEYSGPAREVDSRTLITQELCLNVTKTMMDIVLLERPRFVPDLHANGLGKVVNTIEKTIGDVQVEAPNPASKIWCDGAGWWNMQSLHPKDTEYSELPPGPKCCYSTSDHFFPFGRDPCQVLPYLLWACDRSSSIMMNMGQPVLLEYFY